MMVKPDPVIAAALTVTGEVPVELSVTDCVAAVFTVTLPKLRLVTLTVNCGFAVGGGVEDDPPLQEGTQSAWKEARA